MATNREQFKSLLRDLFQFDAADLDFGIYRILNQKRDEIERFIQQKLVEEIDDQLSTLQAQDTAQAETEYEEVRDEVINTFGEQALSADGELQDYQETPLGGRYQEKHEAYKQAQEAAEAEELTERRIYDDLYCFFRRYYDKGDFITKRRFSSGDSKYYVPYDGEEVMLHWANRDQYYIKTSERFTDYRFTADNYHVHFKLVDANTPADNTKGDTRYFVPSGESPVTVDADEKQVTIRFEYRPISDGEEDRYLATYNALPGKTYKTLSRSRLCEAVASILLDEIDAPEAQAAIAREDKQSEKPILLTHLNRYTARNSTDYFVHKNLGGFLRGQLDFFIKNEILQLEDVLGEMSGQALQQARVHANVVKSIGERIIDFLAQIEDFQKRLFEKKKFVVQTDYCITVDQVPEELYPEILDNDEQLQEWTELYATDQWGQSLEWNGTFDEAFLQTHPYVMIDTAHFDQEFKDQLLASFDDLDAIADGLLIHGENYQALNLLQERYREQVKCIYIDPPYNTGGDGFLYKDQYQHSTWASMMDDRLHVARRHMAEDGAVFSSIDDGEQANLKKLLGQTFGGHNFVTNIVWQKKYSPQNDATWFSDDHDYLAVYAKNKSSWRPDRLPRTDKQNKGYTNPDNDPRGPWMSDNYTSSKSKEERPNLFYPITNPNTNEEIWPSEDRVWAYSPEQHQKHIEEERIWWGVDGTNSTPRYKRFLNEVPGVVPRTVWTYQKAGHNQDAVREVQALFGRSPFASPKPTKLVRRILQVAPGDLVMDYFAGSGTTGHAVMAMNQEEDEERRYILVEMGEYFDTVLKPRLKKVAFTNNWKDGVPQDRNGQTHGFKYQRLESYEDTLNNLRIEKPEGPQMELLYEEMDDYVLHYMLEHETDGSPSLLAEDAFTHPFDYTLQIQQNGESPEPASVDLVETFHYIMGLTEQQRHVYQHQGRRYVVTSGTIETAQGVENALCIWRDTEDPEPLNLNEEADWAEATVLPDTPIDSIYVNGTTHIRGAEPIEIPFRKRMG